MKISVVTVCLNSRATIDDVLASVASQRTAEREHIVIDGASTDGTVERIRAFRPPVTRLVSEPDRGLYDAMNKGIARATGDVLGFLNSDDVYADAGALERVARAFADPEVDACYGDLVYVKSDDTSRVVRYWKSSPYAPGSIERGWMPPHPTLYVRTSILRKIGGFDTRYRYRSDFEMVIRLFLKERIRAAYIPGILVKMRTGGQTNRSLRYIVAGNLDTYRACRDNGLDVSPLFILRKIASRVPQLFRRPARRDPDAEES